MPPEGFETEDYLLTTQRYTETVLAIADALGHEDPILAGCSMAAALRCRLRHFILDASAGSLPLRPRISSRHGTIDWFHRPDAHGGEMGAALVSANIAPHAPMAERWNTLWMFTQSGPGVFRGDLSFYTRDDSLNKW